MSVQARDRKLDLWYKRIHDGEIKLPRFLRFEAWDKGRICSLLNMIIHDLPLGITLLLEVDQEQFISRYIASAEIKSPPYPRVIEHLLDGQQRLMAIWRTLHNNYESEKYFLYIKEFDKTPVEDQDDGDDEWGGNETVYCQNRWTGKRSGRSMPIWADVPEDCLERGLIPMELFRPEDITVEISNWIARALESKKPEKGDENFENLFEAYSEEKQKLVCLIIASGRP